MAIMAVLTGDLIHSQTVRDTSAFINGLKNLLQQLDRLYGVQAEIFRGDGFQLVPKRPELAFSCAVALRAGLIAASPDAERWDARVAIGLGADGTPQHFGEAFVLSGQGLDRMKKSTLGVFSRHAALLERAELPTAFAESIIEHWTPVEAQTYFLHLTQGLDQQGLAEALGKSRVTITKALQRANARLMDRYLDNARNWIEELQHD